MEQIVMMRPDEWARFKEEMKDQVSRSINEIKGLIVEKPLTFKEMADHLSITEDALRKRKRMGKMPADLFHKSGGTVYGFASELNTWLKTKNRKP